MKSYHTMVLSFAIKLYPLVGHCLSQDKVHQGLKYPGIGSTDRAPILSMLSCINIMISLGNHEILYSS